MSFALQRTLYKRVHIKRETSIEAGEALDNGQSIIHHFTTKEKTMYSECV